LPDIPAGQGNATVRAILAERSAGSTVTRSELEERFLSFLAHAGLPRPEVNVHLEAGGRLLECDCVWRAARLAVELDGHAFHGTPTAYERDRARDRALSAAGWRVVRVTWNQLQRERRALSADLEVLLSGP
jgi:hypothetical protein